MAYSKAIYLGKNEACTISQDNYVEIEAPENLNFRPIVAGPIYEVQIENFIEILLQPYSKYVKSYIKDTTDFFVKTTTIDRF